jgi:hypothetical protein
MKPILTLSILALLSASCSSSNSGDSLPAISSIKPSVSREGSLANATLTRDASQAIHRAMRGNAKIVKFVIQQPAGPAGKKAWREIWIYDPEAKDQHFIMTFREDGQGSTGFEIQKV